MSKKKYVVLAAKVPLAYVSSTKDGKFNVVHGLVTHSRATREDANALRDQLNGVEPQPIKDAAEPQKQIHSV